MRSLSFDDPARIDQCEFERLLSQVSVQRREKVQNFKFFVDQVQSVLVYRLLQDVLQKNYGIQEIPEFVFGEKGKPYLKGYPGIFFNLSHCRKMVMCAVADEEIGCDVEEIPERLDLDECRFCFNEAEIKDILGAKEPCVQFTRWWTMKEAYLKLTGRGLTDNLPALFTAEVMKNYDFEVVEKPESRVVYALCFLKKSALI